MIPNDAGRILAMLAAAFPQSVIGDDTSTIWTTELRTLDLVPAHEAVRVIVRRDEWFPTVARFLSTYREVVAAGRAERAITRTRGRCDACGGSGWRYVDEDTNTVARCGCSIPDQDVA